MTKQEFADLTKAGIVLLDGATGSNLRAAGMPVGVPPERWNLDHPQALLDLQRAYVSAGSQILCAPTFSANRLALRHYFLEEQVAPLNVSLVELSKEAAGGRALVAGDLATLGQPMEPNGRMTYARAYDIYREQIEALAEAGVDLLAAETLMGSEEALALLDAASSVCGLPVLCAFSAEADGSLIFGGSVREAARRDTLSHAIILAGQGETLQEMGAAAVGVNCSVGPDQLEAVVRTIREAVDIPVVAKPNAGLPVIDHLGRAHYAMGPEEFARHMAVLVEAGAAVVGGCCGTTPAYIRRLAGMLR